MYHFIFAFTKNKKKYNSNNNNKNNNNNGNNNNSNIIKSLFNENLYLPNALRSEAGAQMIVKNIKRFHVNASFLHLQNRDFLMCSGGVEMEHCREIG